MIRYLRQTKFISLRGKYGHTYIDLEQRRLTEINSILDNDNAQPKEFNIESEWIEYFTTYDTYQLPYETVDNLFYILKNIEEENMIIAEESNVTYNSYYEGISDKNKLKVFIEKAREERTRLQNIQLKTKYYSIDKIDETIMFLKAIQNKDKAYITGIKAREIAKKIEGIDGQITTLRARLKKESQFNNKMELNIEIKKLEQKKDKII